MGLTFGDSEETIRKADVETLLNSLLTSDGIGTKKKAIALEALIRKVESKRLGQVIKDFIKERYP